MLTGFNGELLAVEPGRYSGLEEARSHLQVVKSLPIVNNLYCDVSDFDWDGYLK